MAEWDKDGVTFVRCSYCGKVSRLVECKLYKAGINGIKAGSEEDINVVECPNCKAIINETENTTPLRDDLVTDALRHLASSLVMLARGVDGTAIRSVEVTRTPLYPTIWNLRVSSEYHSRNYGVSVPAVEEPKCVPASVIAKKGKAWHQKGGGEQRSTRRSRQG